MRQIKVKTQNWRIANKQNQTCYDKNRVCGSNIDELFNIITRGHPVDDGELLQRLDQVGFNRGKLSSPAGLRT